MELETMTRFNDVFGPLYKAHKKTVKPKRYIVLIGKYGNQHKILKVLTVNERQNSYRKN